MIFFSRPEFLMERVRLRFRFSFHRHHAQSNPRHSAPAPVSSFASSHDQSDWKICVDYETWSSIKPYYSQF